jgi:Ca-activated chloride channel homolog
MATGFTPCIALLRNGVALALLLSLVCNVPTFGQSGRVSKRAPASPGLSSGSRPTEPTIDQKKSPERRQLPNGQAAGAGEAATRNDGPVDPTKPPVLLRRDAPPTSDSAPAAPASAESDDDVIKIEASLVSLPVVVSDGNGQYIPFLKKQDFSLYEDGTAQDISFFTSDRVPFHVALVLDTSGSTVLSINDIQDAAISFVEQLRDEDKVSVMAFSDKLYRLCGFTSELRVLREAIRRTRSGGSTRLYESVSDIVEQDFAGIEGRKAMILLTDGEDTSSKKGSHREALEKVAEAGVLTYVVQYPPSDPNYQNGGPMPGRRSPMPFPFPWPGNPNPRRDPPRRPPNNPNPFAHRLAPPQKDPSASQGPNDPNIQGSKFSFLVDVTRISGGSLHPFTDIADMDAIFTQIATELRHIYIIGFYPTRPLALQGYRKLRVLVNKPEAKVRARSGYYARAPQPVTASLQP